jgi:hypothetical protein
MGPRKIPLMRFSLCNIIAGFSPNFAFSFFLRALLGIAMGAEWPFGASLAMEAGSPTWMHESTPARFVGVRLPDVQCGVRVAVQLHRLARLVVDRHPAGARCRLGKQIRQGARGVATESAEAAYEKRKMRVP